MKRFIAIVAALFCFAGFSFTEEYSELERNPDNSEKVLMKTRTIVPEDQHTTNKTASVQIDFTPLTDEAHIYYKCMAVSYDQGEAMNTVLACLQDFQKENQYYSYKYLRKDSVKYYKDEQNMKWATYHSYVKFNR